MEACHIAFVESIVFTVLLFLRHSHLHLVGSARYLNFRIKGIEVAQPYVVYLFLNLQS